MRLLLDTHTLLWALCEPEKLSPKISELLVDINNVIFVSVASLWELQIKKSIGKVITSEKFATMLKECGYEMLNITVEHVEKLDNLPLIHRDPFDRIIISQSIHENISLVTKDSEILKYNIDLVRF